MDPGDPSGKENVVAKRSLVVVESPTKVKTIQKYLNNKYVVKASMGHVRERPERVSGEDAHLVVFSAWHLHDEPAARGTGPDNCRPGLGEKYVAWPGPLPPSYDLKERSGAG